MRPEKLTVTDFLYEKVSGVHPNRKVFTVHLFTFHDLQYRYDYFKWTKKEAMRDLGEELFKLNILKHVTNN